MNSSGILHFTVNADGRISLWDTPQAAVSGKEPDEVVVQISLTKPQMALVIRGEMLAAQKRREAQTTGSSRRSPIRAIPGDDRLD